MDVLKLRMPTFIQMGWMDRKTMEKQDERSMENHGTTLKTLFLISNAHLEFWHFIFHPHY